MKMTISFFVFILTLSLGIKSVASEQAATCKPEENKNCAEMANEHGAKAAGAHDAHGKKGKDWTHKRLEQVAAVLPQPTANKEVVQRPAKVNLVAPKFLSTISGTSAKLEWAEVTGATHYHVQVSKDAGFNNRSMYVADEKFVKGTSFEVTGLEAGHKYFWRVSAINDKNDSMYIKSLFNSSAFEVK